MMKRKIFSIIFILIGISLIAYPKVSESYQNYQQEKLIEQWQESLAIIDEGYDEEEEEEDPLDYLGEDDVDTEDNDIEDPAEADIEEEEVESEEEKKERLEKEKKARQAKDQYIKDNLDGMLIIDKIDLNMPILKGATQKNMKISVASMENTGQAGDIGNYVVTGHRSFAFGRNFNRLEEVDEGDIVSVNDGENQYDYLVVDKLYVLPEEVWVLNRNNIDREITLITCHPMGNPTHRLIIKGEIIKK